ncbi:MULTISPECIES: flavodoxin-dependent (E)-4-hydroxy-3-methylbut-2-enyl-diphosphate synthase [Clostridium]|mgnify:CR=1 FL=1|jgi:(E)-4-hydroxy-3-methylbut-2-enyl-diphosphate synthase|uniref:flavodoxin-dependent (E)-4-hydroxy-3-methylbut-2-enyl-diphosphate synthase n=1 Tax=Clostridium TaxID=1485 RepID=UPI00189F322B|nr:MULTISPECIES: flavodoxin-dependent (E)-4-hydroxy-3-methylbut-2-enyl-diphosphate synthase [Clostridium]MDB2092108.1 flavodoxin-dependent (E)-4-hydroxy-3-methylbut-2-enyl-diphosphate synthase [Clostridium paraputrificum]MDB2116273.1 flavodoxin-dependent (E)-4-hydroxy-3-methylbut-2-enyl-diphosphate synthase [Clostridium paraputrificum]MDB2121727.1 flavodoxin-dependent (E)-4-hydroxy-3-methylbut-2-enyl-diphosphate synthase [Clostridium paraputrificum]MDU2755891.1 flavodoxin-dependent (E)-4-hydrox
MDRKLTRKVKVGKVYVGGDAPVTIQSMTNTDTRDVEATLKQIRELYNAGCEIIRCTVPDMEAAEAIKEIVKQSPIPVVADIHFDYRLALKVVENGISAVRINPGNIGSIERVRMVAEACKAKNIPIRIGVNSGSLEKEILEREGKPTAKGLVESALAHVKILEAVDFNDIVISIKSSDVRMMIDAYRLMSEKVDYPLHLGVTESGTPFRGTIKSSIGIGTLLAEGIGDTIRVSLTSDPIEEIKVAKEMLKALGLRKGGLEFVSCPTCGRTQIKLIEIANEVERRLEGNNKDIKVAVMGCIVNGPGEAREADIGIAGGKGEGIIFKKGEIIKKCKEEDLIEELMKEIELL